MHILELSDYASTSAVTLEALAAVAMHVASEPTRVVFGVGAGISTAAGIPDFRGGATSLYGAESVRHPTRSHSTLDTRLATTRTAARTKDLFHHDVLLRLESRAEHLGMMATLRKAAKRVTRKGKERTISDGAANAARGAPTAFHGLMKRVAENGRLMRVYSQNIDGLEAAAGLVSPPPRFAETEAGGDRKTRSRIEADDSSSDFDRPRRKTPRRRAPTLAPSPQDLPVVALHGSLDHVHCSVCHHREKWKKRHTRAYKRGRRLPCPNCHDRAQARVLRAGRTIDPAPLAFLRPAVVLYDDPSFASSPAAHLISSTIEADMRSEPACLVVAGTSLRIPGFRSLVKDLSRVVKRNGGWSILVNRENVGKEWDRFFDFHFLGDTEVFANHLTAFLDSLLPAASPTLADLPPDVTLAPPLASQTPVLELRALSPLSALSLPPTPPSSAHSPLPPEPANRVGQIHGTRKRERSPTASPISVVAVAKRKRAGSASSIEGGTVSAAVPGAIEAASAYPSPPPSSQVELGVALNVPSSSAETDAPPRSGTTNIGRCADKARREPVIGPLSVAEVLQRAEKQVRRRRREKRRAQRLSSGRSKGHLVAV